jgi:murein DD-endopeptidase MepM/ murein hydrolase activator NlpD
MRLLPIVVVAILLAAPAAGKSAQDCDSGVCIQQVLGGAPSRLVVTNERGIDVWVELWFTSSENLFVSDQRYTKLVKARSSGVIAVLQTRDPKQRYSYRYRWIFSPGDPNSVPDRTYRYAVPLSEERRDEALAAVKAQQNGAAGFFNVAAGEAVVAAREGRVAEIESLEGTAGGTIVRVLHPDRTIGEYLMAAHVLVKEGAPVQRGDLLARATVPGAILFKVSKGRRGRGSESVAYLIDDGSVTGCLIGD